MKVQKLGAGRERPGQQGGTRVTWVREPTSDFGWARTLENRASVIERDSAIARVARWSTSSDSTMSSRVLYGVPTTLPVVQWTWARVSAGAGERAAQVQGTIRGLPWKFSYRYLTTRTLSIILTQHQPHTGTTILGVLRSCTTGGESSSIPWLGLRDGGGSTPTASLRPLLPTAISAAGRAWYHSVLHCLPRLLRSR